MTSTIHKGLLQFIFSGSYMKRWNDKLRLMELIEIDKQAHKMIVAWLLCQLSGKSMPADERLRLEEEVIEGGIFDYLFRLAITDIKPPILYRIKENASHYQRLVQWAIGETSAHLLPLGSAFFQRFKDHVSQMTPKGKAAEILAAAHLYATVWEFRMIRPLNDAFDDELPDIDKRFTEQLAEYSHLPGMPDLIHGLERHGLVCRTTAGHIPTETLYASVASAPPFNALARFANLCGQLRFQKRWSQTPRIPETSVMGHMFIVACYAYLLSIALKTCRARRVNNFFCGLFHDLPELLTRDIISPVKKSFQELEELIKEYELSELNRRIFDPLTADGFDTITERLHYYLGLATGSEFNETIIQNGIVKTVSFGDLQTIYNHDELDPKDGKTVKLCDTLAAYIEAYTAMRNGIASDQIQQAFWRLREQHTREMHGHIHIGALFRDFD